MLINNKMQPRDNEVEGHTRTRCRDLTEVVTLGLPRDTLPYIVVDGATIR